MNITIELVSHSQDEKVLSLLRFPQRLLRPRKAKIIVDREFGGRAEKRKPATIEDFILEAGQEKHNYLRMEYKSRPEKIPGTEYIIHRLWQELTLSPTNNLWFDTKDFPAASLGKGMYLSCQSREYGLRYQEIKRFPSCLRMHIQIPTGQTMLQFGDWVFDALAESIPEELIRGDITGAAGFAPLEAILAPEPQNGPNPLTLLLPNFFTGRPEDGGLYNWTGAYAQLGEKFAGLFPYLIGPVRLCAELGNALGNRVALKEVSTSDGQATLGILRIPHDMALDPHAASVAAPWLVTKDETTARRNLGGDPGIIKIGNSPYYIQKRYKELRAADRIWPELPHSAQYLPLISDKYCHLLGIDPDEMLIGTTYRQTYEESYAEIDAYFAALPSEIPLRERIWEAHETAWEKLFRYVPIIVYIHDKYFPDLTLSVHRPNE